MKIEHLAIWVKDLEKMMLFYQRYFNAQPGNIYRNTNKGFSSYFMSFSDGPRLELMHMESIPKNLNDIMDQYIGLNHMAISLGTIEKVDKMTEMFRSDGFQIIGEPRWTGDGYYESVILDPEQNRIELTA